jgi:L-asparaginase
MSARTVVRVCAALLLSAAAASAQPTNAPKPAVLVLATGGTISNTGGGDSLRRTGSELVTAIPRLASYATVTAEQFSNVASGAITTDQWRALAKRIHDATSRPDGAAAVIVTHGTDTMEETAFFLDLTVSGCAPVILTGAMRRATDTGADGPANLLNAVRAAVSPDARGRGTMVLMNDLVFAARDVTKLNTTRPDAFGAPYLGPLGVVDPDTVAFHRPRATTACHEAPFDVDRLPALPRVEIIESYIGADSVLIDAAIAAGAKGLVIAGVGRGGMTPAQGRAIRRAAQRGIFVVTSSRTGSGRVDSGADLSRWKPGEGALIGAGDLNPQKARILLMLALARGGDAKQIVGAFER